ncbi:Transketolase, C-terminal section (EC [Olavius algarvensis Delta 1 endosymbiont]|nr:Transketolase, C-terminal section (EC [Olavius algarvensis Delta 1 endosymbiont]
MRCEETDLRDAFFDGVLALARNDARVLFLTADMGAFSLNQFRAELPAQFINVGVAEQNLINLAAGLALGGKKVFAYGIAPFVTLRCFEQIKVSLCCMNLPVTLVAVGLGFTYGSDGPTHHATHDVAVMRTLPEMAIYNPSDAVITAACAQIAYDGKGPQYIRIERGRAPRLYSGSVTDFSKGLSRLKTGTDLTIISTGIMSHTANIVADKLAKTGIDAGLIDLYRIKPVNAELLLEYIRHTPALVTLEENAISGGLGSVLSEILVDSGLSIPLKRIGAPDTHCCDLGPREWIQETLGLNDDAITDNIMTWYRGSFGG